MTTDPQAIKARLNDVAADVRDVYQDAVCCINELQCQVSDLRVDRDEAIQARKNQSAHLEHIAAGNIGNFKTPRVIAADELKEGQLICIHRGHGWGVRAIGNFVSRDGDVVTLKTGGSGTFSESTKFHTIVLLADAPVEQQEPERLTIEDLENAPVGSELSGLHGHRPWTKREDGLWDGGYDYSSASARFDSTLSERTLITPAPVTAEAIRASEPGSTWENSSGNVREVWDWNGKALIGRSTGRNSGPAFATRHWGPFTRSTAAPRGDYGEKELPTEPGEVIRVTEFGGLYDAAEPIGAYRTNGNTWRRLDQEPWPGDYLGLYAPDEEITGWKPAKVVTDD